MLFVNVIMCSYFVTMKLKPYNNCCFILRSRVLATTEKKKLIPIMYFNLLHTYV